MRALLSALAVLPVAAALGAPLPPPIDVQELRSIGGLAPHLAGAIEEMAACHLTADGNYVIFDRRQHAVFAAAPRDAALRKIVQIGFEPGKLLRPLAFDSAPDGTFAVADAPAGRNRVQFFVYAGAGLGGFTMPGSDVRQITLGNVVVSGIASLEYTGASVLISQPEVGGLVTEYSTDGRVLRTFGELRRTGQEDDRNVHSALNVGLPLADPKGGFYYVFISGTPMFRKYDAKGTLVFERHIEGVELDAFVGTLPTTWDQAARGKDNLPVVPVSVRAAAVAPDGALWISLAVPYTYVYDTQGDKRRTIQFRGAGIISPNSLFFTRDNRVLVTPGCYAFPTT